MALNLNPVDRWEYDRRLAPLEAAKQAARASGDVAAAKRARRSIGALYDEFAKRQPPPPPPTAWELEKAMTVEQRLDRIEQHLGMGRWSNT